MLNYATTILSASQPWTRRHDLGPPVKLVFTWITCFMRAVYPMRGTGHRGRARTRGRGRLAPNRFGARTRTRQMGQRGTARHGAEVLVDRWRGHSLRSRRFGSCGCTSSNLDILAIAAQFLSRRYLRLFDDFYISAELVRQLLGLAKTYVYIDHGMIPSTLQQSVAFVGEYPGSTAMAPHAFSRNGERWEGSLHTVDSDQCGDCCFPKDGTAPWESRAEHNCSRILRRPP